MAEEDNLFRAYVKEICSNCKNGKTCQEELRIRVDGSIWCTEYEYNKPKRRTQNENRRKYKVGEVNGKRKTN